MLCVKIYSDNASTFVGAANELKEFLKNNCDFVTYESSKDSINFSFIHPKAHNFGGLWESELKVVKS